jgi:hypothetical protein
MQPTAFVYLVTRRITVNGEVLYECSCPTAKINNRAHVEGVSGCEHISWLQHAHPHAASTPVHDARTGQPANNVIKLPQTHAPVNPVDEFSVTRLEKYAVYSPMPGSGKLFKGGVVQLPPPPPPLSLHSPSLFVFPLTAYTAAGQSTTRLNCASQTHRDSKVMKSLWKSNFGVEECRVCDHVHLLTEELRAAGKDVSAERHVPTPAAGITPGCSFKDGNYVPHSLTKTTTTSGPHEASPARAKSRLAHDAGGEMEPVAPGRKRCLEASSCGKLCECGPGAPLSLLNVGDFMQASVHRYAEDEEGPISRMDARPFQVPYYPPTNTSVVLLVRVVCTANPHGFVMAAQVVQITSGGCPVLAPVDGRPGAPATAVAASRRVFLNAATGEEVYVDTTALEGGVHKWLEARAERTSLFFYRFGFASHASFYSEKKQMSWEYGMTGAWKLPIHSITCLNRKCVLLYDGEEDGLFRSSLTTAICQSVLRMFTYQMLGGGATFQAYCEQVQLQYDAHGSKSKFLGEKAFGQAHYNFLTTQPQVGFFTRADLKCN